MKSTLLGFCLIFIGVVGATAQNSGKMNYEEQWKKIDKLRSEENLPKSALVEIEKVYTAAVSEQQYAQAIKAIVYRMNCQAHLEEDPINTLFASLDKEANTMPQPAKSLVYYLLGQLHYDYFNQNKWTVLQRTRAEVKLDDRKTWDATKLLEVAVQYYNQSLENADALQRIPLADYSVLMTGNNVDYQKTLPSLYDFLAYKAFSFFSDQHSDLTQPQQSFLLNKPDYFADAFTFINCKIETTDTLSLQYQALLLLQKVIAFKLVDANTNNIYVSDAAALVNWDMRRLDFLKSNGRYADNDALYEKALKQLIKTYNDKPEQVYPNYALAYLYNQWGKTWRSTKRDDFRNKRVEAYAICKDILAKYPKSEVSSFARTLMSEIEASSASLQMSGNELPDQAILAFVDYCNVDSLYVFVYEIDNALYDNFKFFDNHYLQEKILKNGKLVHQTKQILPSQKDYQGYSTEIKLNSLKQGNYVVFISNSNAINSSSNTNNKVLAFSFFQVSNLYLVAKGSVSGQMLYVTNRKTGKPIAEAKVQIYSYDYRNGDGKYKLYETAYTNQNGEVSITKNDNLYNPKIIVSKGDERLIAYKNYFDRAYNNDFRSTQAILFTDRSIYRPGQTVYYKGLVFKTDSEDVKKELVPNLSLAVSLMDVNWQQVASERLKTNEYGTVQGSFTLPQGLLNGTMTLSTPFGSQAIQVEEYKRPTFEVKFNPLTDNYALNNKVQLSANAKALAGYSVDDAKVQYRVVRSTKHTWYRWWYPMVSAPEREIASGILKTDTKGDFIIDFVAEADDVKNTDLIYVYKVVADVTDINGETRSASLLVNVGKKPLLLDVTIPDQLKAELAELPINTTNLNGDFTPANISVTINELAAPTQLYRTRLWGAPDTLLIPRNEFEKDFPLDSYGAALSPDKFVVGKQLSQASFNTAETKKLSLSALQQGKAGWYSIKIKAVDKNGIEIENTYYTKLLPNKPQRITSMDEWLTVIKNSGEPGESAEFWVAGGESKSYIKYELLHKNKVVEQKLIETGTTPQRIVIPITEQHRGGFVIEFGMVQNNRLYTSHNTVTVPFTNKELEISFTSFRDMLLPGEHEKWTLRIKNKKGEKEMAEMVATLYDASLDALRPHSWADITRFYSQSGYYNPRFNPVAGEQAIGSRSIYSNWASAQPYSRNMPNFNFFDRAYFYALQERNDFYRNDYILEEVAVMGYGTARVRGASSMAKTAAPVAMMDMANSVMQESDSKKESAETGGNGGAEEQAQMELSEVATRQNFNETAFFYPQLRTDENGEIIIEFVIPEALTRWKMMGFAHTKDLKIGTIENKLITQKQVAISANAPRFFRENDTLVLAAKVNNITEGELSGQAMLQLYDALTMQPVTAEIVRTQQTLPFTVKAGESTGVSWTLKIPAGLQAIGYKVTAQAGNYTDGEEKVVPVLVNSMLVTETMPFYIRGGQEKKFTFNRLKDVKSSTLRNHSLTLEYTSAPAWYAIQSMPYLMEYPYECAEQVFSRYYANSLATTVVNSSPRVKQVFDLWRTLPDSKALLSNLEKNQELKQALLEETPWVMQAKNETERKKRVGLLFDLNRMSNELNRALNKLEKMQYSDGGFPWFDGLPASRYITQHVVAGIEHLKKLNAISEKHVSRSNTMLGKSLNKLDSYILDDYNDILKAAAQHVGKLDYLMEAQHISSIQLHYLYASSFSKHKPANPKQVEAFDYYFNQAATYWNTFGLYEKAMLSLVMDRYDRRDIAIKIINSLKENAQQSDGMGMYWKSNTAGYFWYQAPIETQAMLIEAFDEVAKDKQSVEEMKIWLLRNKQTNDWKTTKATAEACYALLMTGNSFLSNSQPLKIKIAGKPLAEVAKGDITPEPGTGYVKTVWDGSEITADMATLQVNNPNPSSMAWGAMYWQYFEQLDKITHAETDLKMNKQLFLKTITTRGEVLQPITENNVLKIGDVVKVRMELRADRAYEYVHLKDMRAAGFEPVSTISGHRYQDGLWYYESIKDASTNFFITYLSKGTYVFEYELRVSHSGGFSNGITTFQCMYAPEFSAHSEGIRVQVKTE